MAGSPHPSTATRTLLVLGSSLTAATAAYHFFLPTMFDWAAEVKSVHPNVTWALFSLNCFFSCLLLALGGLTLAGVLARRTHEWTFLAVASAGALFWLVNGGYQVLAPMPMPARLAGLGVFLKAFALAVALCYLIPVVALARSRGRSGG